MLPVAVDAVSFAFTQRYGGQVLIIVDLFLIGYMVRRAELERRRSVSPDRERP